jgi:hypothetical protein
LGTQVITINADLLHFQCTIVPTARPVGTQSPTSAETNAGRLDSAPVTSSIGRWKTSRPRIFCSRQACLTVARTSHPGGAAPDAWVGIAGAALGLSVSWRQQTRPAERLGRSRASAFTFNRCCIFSMVDRWQAHDRCASACLRKIARRFDAYVRFIVTYTSGATAC